MVSEYRSAALHRAHYEILAEDGSYYGEIPGFEGVYANAPSLEACREELREVLEEWIFVRVSRGHPVHRLMPVTAFAIVHVEGDDARSASALPGPRLLALLGKHRAGVELGHGFGEGDAVSCTGRMKIRSRF